MRTGTPEAPGGGKARRWLATGAAVAVVLAFAGVAFALHGGIGPAAGITASTPPDTAQVTVTERKGVVVRNLHVYFVPNPDPIVVHQQTITDAATVRQLQGWLNAPADASAALPTCAADAPNANTLDGAFYIYTVTFTAQGITIERVDILMRCWGMAIQRGYTPSLALSGEVAAGPDVYRVMYIYDPKDLAPRSGTLAHP